MKFDPSTITAKQLRSFGFLMAGLFLVIGLWPMVWKGESIQIWSVSVSVIWAGAAVAVPAALTPLYKLWMKLAEKLGWFNTRVLLGIIFFLVITPFAFVMKVLGKKPLERAFDQQRTSYRELKESREANHVMRPF